MDSDRLRKLTAIIYAVARAETPEEYATIRNECYAATEEVNDSLQRTVFDDLANQVFDRREPRRISESQQRQQVALSELMNKVNASAVNIFAGSEEETPMAPGDFRLTMSEF